MKILWVNPNFLHPTTKGGQIRTLEMLRQLHRHHEIHYVAYEDPQHPEGVERSGEYSSHAYPVRFPVSSKGSPAFYRDAVKNLFGALPLAVSRYGTPAMARQIAELRARHQYDSLVCDFLFPAPNIPDMNRWVLFQHNVESVIWRRRLENAGNPLQRRYLTTQHARMAAYEAEVCRESAYVVAVSDVDASTMRDLYGVERVGAVPTGVDTAYFARPDRTEAKADLVFLGSMDWMPNIDGVKWFTAEVLPLIWKRRPETTFAVVGRTPPPAIRQLAEQDSRVTVTGTVPDVRPYLWGAQVSVVPLRIGGGTRLKIYEAMAAGVPVVSTTIGAEGLAVSPPRDIRLADEPADVARECLALLAREAERRAVAQAGQQLVESVCSWNHAVRIFEEYLVRAGAPVVAAGHE